MFTDSEYDAEDDHNHRRHYHSQHNGAHTSDGIIATDKGGLYSEVANET